MNEAPIFLKGKKESNLHVFICKPSSKVKGVLHILHGMGEHAKRYQDFADFLTSLGFVVVAHDHRGHGLSLKPKQTVGILDKSDTHQAMIDDIDVVHKYIVSRYKDVPIFMLGHSMGSMLLRQYLSTYKPHISKAIIMGTLPKYNVLYIKVMRALVAIMRPFSRQNKPHNTLSKMLNDGLIKKIDNHQTSFDWLSYNQDNVTNYIQDPLSGYAYNYRFYQSFFKLIDRVSRKKTIEKTPDIPLLMISGEDDPINDKNKALNSTFDAYKAYNVTVIKVLNARHEILHELHNEDTYRDIHNWLTAKGVQ